MLFFFVPLSFTLSSQPLIGHVHIAKTGGTALNEILANTYEGVCGHKGYSFDFYRAYLRAKDILTANDSIGRVRPGYNRLRVPGDIMVERGFESCDWVSHEADIKFWQRFKDFPRPLELHVPCRDPVEHFMSQVNHRRMSIDCKTFIPEKDAPKMMIYLNQRFRYDGLPSFAKVRCLAFASQFSSYPQQINLRKKNEAFIIPNIAPLKTNRKRTKSLECIWKNDTLRKSLETYLVQNYDYYNFCAICSDWVTD